VIPNNDGVTSFDELFRRSEAENDAALALAEAAAAETGKEPFDLSRLEQLLGEERGSLAARERRLRSSYYVSHPELRTLAEFAAFRLEQEVWDGSGMRDGDGPFGE
jgi:hypothetical protein